MATSSSKTKLSMKLLIDTEAKRVFFAEASKEVIDFLFSFLEIPLGSVVKLLSSNETTPMNNDSQTCTKAIKSLIQLIFKHTKTKNTLLDPLSRRSSQMATLLIPARAAVATPEKKYYKCGTEHCRPYFCDVCGTTCPKCCKMMIQEMIFVNAANDLGFVKGDVTYTIMDDLSVVPISSTISTIAILSKFKVKDVGALKEKIVELGAWL